LPSGPVCRIILATGGGTSIRRPPPWSIVTTAATRFPTRIDGDIAVVSPSSRISVGESAEAFRAAVDAAFASGARSILLDVTHVPYLDSSGIGELLAAMRHARETGGKVVLFGQRGKIHEILDLTKLIRLFVVCDTEGEAREAAKTAPR
jgi:anti-sigma B factor antagonist